MATNYFETATAAERYAKGRPYYHPLVMERVRQFLELRAPVTRAIDVGCGTGMSTRALAAVAERAIGVDPSAAMVARAPRDAGVEFAVGTAEQLPVREAAFELMTLSAVFHWLERGRFFSEARRVLKPGGWLVVYDHYFAGEMVGNEAFRTWAAESYLRRYPAPPRAPALAFEDADALREGFRFASRDDAEDEVEFTVDGLANFFVTQSNVIAAVEGGHEVLSDVLEWLRGEIRPLFEGRASASFLFRTPIWYLQKQG
jgi:SAM-dependent methyltransferase